MEVVWRWCGGGVEVVWRWCEIGVELVWGWCGGGVEVVWRWCGVVWMRMIKLYMPHLVQVELCEPGGHHGRLGTIGPAQGVRV